ncbi:HlyD family type I secretion periplasmic adaptor subunit [Aeromonas veronii]
MTRFIKRLKTGIQTWYQSRPQRHEREFLPAALEILDTPASPAGRALAWLVMLFATLALLWAYLGVVDVNAVATGQLTPLGGAKPVQPFENGVVRHIHVTNGQHVTAGQVLIELDATENQVDLAQLQRQLKLAEQDVMRANAMIDVLANEAFDDDAILSASLMDQLEAEQKHRLHEQLSGYLASERVLRAQLAESEAVVAASLAEQAKLAAQLPVLTEKAQAWKRLLEQKMGARLQWLEIESERVTTQKELDIVKIKTVQYRANIRRLQAELEQRLANARRDALAELVAANDKVKEAELNIERYREREQYRTLRAPVSGYVQQLAVETVGAVVQAAQVLLVVAPDHATLVVEARILNQDIGFVRPGQPVTLKVESFPYSKYGTVPATLEHVSQDAIADEKLGSVYAARIRLAPHVHTQTGIALPLQAGMAVTADIKTDSRRVIDYLLSPIKEVFSEAIRER